MTTAEREDGRRRRGLFVLLLVAILLILLGILLGYLAFGPLAVGGTARSHVAGPPSVVGPGGGPVVRPTGGPVVVRGTGQAAAAPAEGSTSATGNGTALMSAGPLVTSSRVVGDVGPSSPATLVLTLANPGSRALLLTALSAQITGVDASAAAGTPACSEAWYHVAPFTGSRFVAAGTRITVELAITFDDLPTVNQDSCKGARYRYAYRAEASPS